MKINLDTIIKFSSNNEKIDYYDEYSKLQLEKFAINIDNQIQNTLMRDLMLKYAELSTTLEEKNKLLMKYNTDLEEMVNEKVKDISDLQISTIFALVKLAESRDDDTGAHIERTSALCRVMAKLLRKTLKYEDLIDDKYVEDIYKASPLHDIGKVGIPDSILLKPGKLTKEEFDIMKTHVNIGYDTLYEVQKKFPKNSFLKMGMDITKYHHEKWDGSGYPDGIRGENIPLSGRIMAIVDVYDALRSKRIYKEPYSHEKTCMIIKEMKGKNFDPLLVDVFLESNNDFKEVYEQII
ncbi:HD domain-containing phosphohydrolase [Tissierella sp. Yu-01]|uniref:HD-GYP domain-containing protein n=1 Tax=Tissierella sp. Yu-01 TaxID=3035694 RepID=UPI00240D767E|nr:HD domain-containing phosphohydrolase [Tissierella sp. Yu-01]WFA09346.1 HD domain-containing protein [Tissierella sp. Yu-01]